MFINTCLNCTWSYLSCTPFIPNSTLFYTLRGKSGEFLQAMFCIVARRSRAKILMAVQGALSSSETKRATLFWSRPPTQGKRHILQRWHAANFCRTEQILSSQFSAYAVKASFLQALIETPSYGLVPCKWPKPLSRTRAWSAAEQMRPIHSHIKSDDLTLQDIRTACMACD